MVGVPDDAIVWLRRSRPAALGAGRPYDWHQYVDSLLLRHARKYSPVPQLNNFARSSRNIQRLDMLQPLARIVLLLCTF
jgi:hypothetical protein